MVEAARCGNIKSSYVQYYGFDFGELSPVSGILLNTMIFVGSVIKYTVENENEWEYSLVHIVAMTMHVLSNTKPFGNCLKAVTDRLLLLYHAPQDDPFEDIFNNHEEERRGPIVTHEALDPSFDYHPEQALSLLDQFSLGVNHAKNLFLCSHGELIKLGVKYPYKVLVIKS